MRLRDLIEDKDLTQKYIASYLNCSQNTYHQYEAEKRQIPLNLLKKLAIFYDTSIDYIVDLTDDNRPYKRK